MHTQRQTRQARWWRRLCCRRWQRRLRGGCSMRRKSQTIYHTVRGASIERDVPSDVRTRERTDERKEGNKTNLEHYYSVGFQRRTRELRREMTWLLLLAYQLLVLLALPFCHFLSWSSSSTPLQPKSLYISCSGSYLYLCSTEQTHLGWHRTVISIKFKVYETKLFVYNITFSYYFDLKYKCATQNDYKKYKNSWALNSKTGPNEPKSHILFHKNTRRATYIKWLCLQPPSVVPLICAFLALIETIQEIHIRTR